jgi:hypothetical protein
LLVLVFRKKNCGVDFKAPARPTHCEAMYKWALYLFFIQLTPNNNKTMVKFFSVFKRRKKRRVSLGVKGYKSKKGYFLVAYINNITRNYHLVKFASKNKYVI